MLDARRPGSGRGRAVAAVLVAGTVVTAGLVVAVGRPEELLAAHTLEDVLAAVAWAAVAGLLAHDRAARDLARLALVVAGCATVAQAGPLILALSGPGEGTDLATSWSGWAWLPATLLPVTLVPLCWVPGYDRACRVVAGLTVLGLVGAALVSTIPGVPDVLWPLAVVAGLAAATGTVVLLVRTARATGRESGGRRALLPIVVAVGVRVAALAAATAVPGAGPVLQVVTVAVVPAAIVVVRARDLLAEVRAARSRLLTATVDERDRLSRDLHDDLGPLLSAIGTCADSALLRLEAGRDDAADPVLRLRAVTDDAVVALRRVLADLAPSGPDGAPLADLLRVLALDLAAARGSAVDVDVRGVEDLPEPWRGTVLRVAAEGLHNASRHARAGSLTVRVRRSVAGVDLLVADDGDGFDPAARPAGHGLRSMADRVAAVGGQLSVTSGDGGTQVAARLPLPQRLLA